MHVLKPLADGCRLWASAATSLHGAATQYRDLVAQHHELRDGHGLALPNLTPRYWAAASSVEAGVDRTFLYRHRDLLGQVHASDANLGRTRRNAA